ncbi:MAG: Eco57I restriction-modification methylase domain-containing protein [Planctomycetota bacterium]|nr:Eco57I restriction-modification methylase domain-containing protein [Planctomycetota bacterium]
MTAIQIPSLPASRPDHFFVSVRKSVELVQEHVKGLSAPDNREFAETLIHRLIFLKFLERRGWLDGNLNYLQDHLDERPPGRFWSEFLAPLFHRCLSQIPQERSSKIRERFGSVPYIESDLIAPNEDWTSLNISIHGWVFRRLFKNLLNNYEFRFEGEGKNIINPSVLGYTYEELINDQHGQGAFYTDPVEVTLMCRESLRLYLELRCPEAPKTLVADLLFGDPIENASGPDAPRQDNLRSLYGRLHEVRICDPAVGTGTFPIGMLQLLSDAMSRLGELLASDAEFSERIRRGLWVDPSNALQLKKHIIENSLYGCDIDCSAVRIARLRFWLEVLRECPSPDEMPALYFSLITGDALVGGLMADDHGNLITMEETLGYAARLHQMTFGKQFIANFGALKKRAIDSKEFTERAAIEKAIAKARDRLLKSLGVQPEKAGAHVLWEIDFAEVFKGANNGFDIVIANPPYLRKEEINSLYESIGLHLTKKRLQQIYKFVTGDTISGHADLYLYFYFRGLDLLKKQDGVLCYISSNAWLDVGYGALLQEHLLKRTQVRAVIENRAVRSFKGADVNTVVVLCHTKDGIEEDDTVRFIRVNESFTEAFSKASSAEVMSRKRPGKIRGLQVLPVNQKRLLNEGLDLNGDYVGNKWGGRYLRAPLSFHELMEAHEWLSMWEVADVVTYLNTGGCDDFYFLRKTSQHNGHTEVASQSALNKRFWVESHFVEPLVRSPSVLECPMVRKADIEHFLLRIPEDTITTGLKVEDYIEWGEANGYHDRTGPRHRSPWWKLPGQAFEGYKILISRHHHDHFNCLYNPQLAVANSFYGLIVHEESYSELALMAYLSSTLGVMMSEIFGRTNQGQGVLNTYGEDIDVFPVFRQVFKTDVNWEEVLFPYLERPFQSIFNDCGWNGPNAPLTPSPERARLDEAVFGCLGLNGDTRDELIKATCVLAEQRLVRASRR